MGKKIKELEIDIVKKLQDQKDHANGILDELEKAMKAMKQQKYSNLMELYSNLIAMDDDIKVLNDMKREFVAVCNINKQKLKGEEKIEYMIMAEKKANESTDIFMKFNDELNKKLISMKIIFEGKTKPKEMDDRSYR